MTSVPISEARSSSIVERQRRFDTAKAFLDALHPLSGEWGPDPLLWIFRGNSDARRPLVPSAHRRRAWKEFGWPLTPDEAAAAARDEPDEIVVEPHRERWILRRYAEEVDRAGLIVPTQLELIPPVGTWGSVEDFQGWPEPYTIPALALAQHYGLPTRMLDWTSRARNAAFFAASKAAAKPSPGKDLEVWGLRTDFVRKHGLKGANDLTICMHKVPTATNANLRAQAGLFTVCRGGLGQNGNRVALDEIIEQGVAKNHFGEVSTGMPILRQFLLPQAEGQELLERLWHDDVHAARLFPDHAGVLQHLKDEHLWKIPPDSANFRPSGAE